MSITYANMIELLDAHIGTLPSNKRNSSQKEIKLVLEKQQTEQFFDLTALAADIKCTVKETSRGKERLIEVFRGFTDYLEAKGVHVPVKYPPIHISDAFERQMYMLKFFQEAGKTRAQLENRLWISSRTIDSDIQALQNYGDNPINVMQQEVIVPLRTGNHSVEFSSTAHPLVLIPNLTQIMIQLKGLQAMCENPLYKGYAHGLACNIWAQLTDYAKERLRHVIESVLREDFSWYEGLASKKQSLFRDETDRTFLNGALMNHLKTEKPFYIKLRNNTDKKAVGPFRITIDSIQGENVRLQTEGMDLLFNLNDISEVIDCPEDLS